MDNHHLFLEDFVAKLTQNATVVEIAEDDREYSIAIAGTTGVIARCHVPRDLVQDAIHDDDVRRRLGLVLKQSADNTVAMIPDGRA
jgi:hypothetical protein